MVRMEAGSPEVVVKLNIQNTTVVLDQFPIQVTGLEASWLTPPPVEVGLFPGEVRDVEFKLHPPRNTSVKTGTYTFQVHVRSRANNVAQSISGVLQVTGEPRLRVELTPRQRAGRGQATFNLNIVNGGDGDARAVLEGNDEEAACDFRFQPSEATLVAAGRSVSARVVVRARKRPWVGRDHAYNFQILAGLLDSNAQGAEATAQFTHHPYIGGWAPIIKGLFALVALVIVGVALRVISLTNLPPQLAGHVKVSLAQTLGNTCTVQQLLEFCSVERFAAEPSMTLDCTFDQPFEEFVGAQAALIGECRSESAYDGFGNGLQYSANGVLFWQKDSNTVYFFTGPRVYAYLAGKSELLYAPP
jgi:hypothetical protein